MRPISPVGWAANPSHWIQTPIDGCDRIVFARRSSAEAHCFKPCEYEGMAERRRLSRILSHTGLMVRDPSASSSSPSPSPSPSSSSSTIPSMEATAAQTRCQHSSTDRKCGEFRASSSGLGTMEHSDHPRTAQMELEDEIDAAASSSGKDNDSWSSIGAMPLAQDCIFCKIVQGYEPAFKLYEDDLCMCILDKNPLCYGHSLLVPKGHFSSLDVTPPRVAAAMCSVVPVISNVIMEATSCDSFNLVVNSGKAAGQVVFHTHFHIVPRFFGDGLWTNESVQRRPLSTFKDPMHFTHIVRSKLADQGLKQRGVEKQH